MNLRTIGPAIAALAFVGTQAVAGTVLWHEGFENYNTDAGKIWGSLDKNKSGGANEAVNGTGNPWFGPWPNNGWVTKQTTNPDVATDVVTPYSGDYMMRGNRNDAKWYSSDDNDKDYVNIAYRFNNGRNFTSDVAVDWYFYDVIGSGRTDIDAQNFHDSAGLSYRDNAPTDTDYANSGVLNAPTQALLVGASDDFSTGYDKSVYQVYMTAATGGYTDGWFNTSISRSTGWHHAAIVVGTDFTSFYIDNTLVLQKATAAGVGYNIFETRELTEVNDATPYDQSAYYDEITLSRVPEPSSMLALGAGLFSLLGMIKRRK